MMEEKAQEQLEEFRENLTLGIVSALERIAGVQDVSLSDTCPCDNIAIASWEQRYATVLPHEIKEFYLATDGFKLTWNYNHAGQLLPLGNMHINRISDLRRVAGLRHRFDTEQPSLLDLEVVNNRDKSSRVVHAPASVASRLVQVAQNSTTTLMKPQFGLRWKMFELDPCSGNGRVCLVFPPKPDPIVPENSESEPQRYGSSADDVIHLDGLVPPIPQVWYLDRAFDWHFLAPNFTTYFRMMLVHLGLPQWQALFTNFGPTPWARHVINLIAPHLLSDPDSSQESYGSGAAKEDFTMVTLDNSIFKTRRISKKNEENN